MTAELPFHPLTRTIPLMDRSQLEALAFDIRWHGQREPITIHRGEIIDGRNRYRACLIERIQPSFREWGGRDRDLPAFLASQNLCRRHLDEAGCREAQVDLFWSGLEHSSAAVDDVQKSFDSDAGANFRPAVETRSDSDEPPIQPSWPSPASGAEAQCSPLGDDQNSDFEQNDVVGGCSYCGRYSEVLNVGRTHFAICEPHNVYWIVGANLFSSWRHESQAIHDANSLRLEAMTRDRDPLPSAEGLERQRMLEAWFGPQK